ncbi:MAG: hypothetical protein IKX81_05170 [Firmicutes bacterium]|nr:hypothetical protein [Bacillota bacterium]
MNISTLSEILNDGITISQLYDLVKEEEKSVPLDKKVERLLYDLMLSTNYKGYKYLKDSIIMLVNNEADSESFAKYVYPALSEKYGVSRQGIEKNMRFAIMKIYGQNTEENILHLLGKPALCIPRPTNAKFVSICAAKLRLER